MQNGLQLNPDKSEAVVTRTVTTVCEAISVDPRKVSQRRLSRPACSRGAERLNVLNVTFWVSTHLQQARDGLAAIMQPPAYTGDPSHTPAIDKDL